MLWKPNHLNCLRLLKIIFLQFALVSALVLSSLASGSEVAVSAIRSLTDPSKIATLKDPRACNDRLLKVVAWLHEAQVSGAVPERVVEAALVAQPQREFVREALLRNLLISSRLGLLGPMNVAAMKRGKSPIVTVGPYSGEIAEVDHILPVAKFPQFSKSFWNLELMPKSLNRRKGDSVGQRQIDLLRKIQQ
jgi:hypothetical protein